MQNVLIRVDSFNFDSNNGVMFLTMTKSSSENLNFGILLPVPNKYRPSLYKVVSAQNSDIIHCWNPGGFMFI